MTKWLGGPCRFNSIYYIYINIYKLQPTYTLKKIILVVRNWDKLKLKPFWHWHHYTCLCREGERERERACVNRKNEEKHEMVREIIWVLFNKKLKK